MAKKEIAILDGAIVVVVGEKYEVYEKPVPSGADKKIDWLGNFGISEKATGKKLKGKVPKYEVQTPEREGKKLYYWSDEGAKELPNQKPITKKKKKFRAGELDLGDPAIGWEK
jgi:hypothetical protein